MFKIPSENVQKKNCLVTYSRQLWKSKLKFFWRRVHEFTNGDEGLLENWNAVCSPPGRTQHMRGKYNHTTDECAEFSCLTERELGAYLTRSSIFALTQTLSWLKMEPKEDGNDKMLRNQVLLSSLSQCSVWNGCGSLPWFSLPLYNQQIWAL